MAKIHNPQDQDGILLINQTTFDGEVAERIAADETLQQNIVKEKERAEGAESGLSTRIDNEKQRAEGAEAGLQSKIEAEAAAREAADAAEVIARNNAISEAITLEVTARNNAISTAVAEEASLREAADNAEVTARNEAIRIAVVEEVTARNEAISTAVAAETSARNEAILNEIKRAEEAETSIMSCLNQVTGHNVWTSLTERPSTTVEATAFEVKGASNLSNIVGKKIKSIDIMVDNTVSTPHYLAIYEDNDGTKVFKGVSSGSVWTQGKTVKFIFETPLIVSGVYEAYIISDLSHAIKPTITTPPTKPDVVLKLYARANNDSNTAGNYRNINGTWNNGKYDFYITYHFEATRLDKIESAISTLEAKVDALPHHEDNRYKFVLANGAPEILPGQNGETFTGTAVLTLNKEDSLIVTASATYGSKQLEPQIDGNQLTLPFVIESTDTTGYIIVNALCDSSRFDNAQYVCYVIPVSFTA